MHDEALIETLNRDLDTMTPAALQAWVAGCTAGQALQPISIYRIGMYEKLQGALAAADSADRSALVISRSEMLAAVLGLRLTKKVDAIYPEHSLLDLRAFADNTFDFCISDQVFEHVAGDPRAAMAASLRVVKPGGYVAHTSVFGYPMHNNNANHTVLGAETTDYWRFTPQAMAMMAQAAGAEVVTFGGHGNRLLQAILHLRTELVACPRDPANPLFRAAAVNDPALPIMVWVVAQKPL